MGTDETYEAEVWAVVGLQYLPKVPVPVQHMAILYHSVAEPDRDVLKLPLRGYVQANFASQLQWRADSGCAGWAAAVRVTAAEILLLLR